MYRIAIADPIQKQKRCAIHYTTIPFAFLVPDTALVFDLEVLVQRITTLVDQRKPRGIRYPLPLILTIAVLAKLAGNDQIAALAEWAQYRVAELGALFPVACPTMPHRTTWGRILGQAIDPVAFDQCMGQFFQECARHAAPRRGSLQVVLDGKTLRGTIPQGQSHGVHLLAAYVPDHGVVLAQVAVGQKENEIVAAPKLLAQLDLRGRVVSGDAMFTQRDVSMQIVTGGGDYLWPVKANQPALLHELELLFDPLLVAPGWSAPPVDFTTATSVDKGHGRITERRITVSSMLAGYSDWPYLAQVFKIERTVHAHGKITTEVGYGITSQPAHIASPQRLLRQTRTHWGIETGLHGRRDGTFQEDRSQLRQGVAPQILATLNNTVLGLLLRRGVVNVAAARRKLEYHINRGLHHVLADAV